MDKETVVISVGGSLIVPDQIDTVFLKNLKDFITKEIGLPAPSKARQAGRGRSFVIIAGGGKTARRYQDASKDVSELAAEDLDWIGIHATRLNGHLLRTVFRDVAHPEIITNPDDVLDVPKSSQLIIAAGYRPGSSTDLRAVQIAERVKAHRMINLSNIDYAYTDDPRTNPEAQKIEKTNWEEFRKLLPEHWDPGLSAPFDPVAAREAERLGMEVAIINGNNFESLENYIENREFKGTLIA